MFNLNERISPLKSFVGKQKKNVERKRNLTRSNCFSLETIQSYFEHCSRKRWKTCQLVNDSFFSPNKRQMNLSLQRFCKTGKEEKDWLSRLIRLSSHLICFQSSNSSEEFFIGNTAEFLLSGPNAICQNISSNRFAKNNWEHFSLLSLNFVIGENVRWETNTFLLFIAQNFVSAAASQ